MLNWRAIGVNALWIVGLALSLAAFSYTDWWAHREGIRRRQALSTPMFLAPFSMGLALISTSFLFKAHHPLERAFWAAWGLLLLGQSISWLIDSRR